MQFAITVEVSFGLIRRLLRPNSAARRCQTGALGRKKLPIAYQSDALHLAARIRTSENSWLVLGGSCQLGQRPSRYTRFQPTPKEAIPQTTSGRHACSQAQSEPHN